MISADWLAQVLAGDAVDAGSIWQGWPATMADAPPDPTAECCGEEDPEAAAEAARRRRIEADYESRFEPWAPECVAEGFHDGRCSSGGSAIDREADWEVARLLSMVNLPAALQEAWGWRAPPSGRRRSMTPRHVGA